MNSEGTEDDVQGIVFTDAKPGSVIMKTLMSKMHVLCLNKTLSCNSRISVTQTGVLTLRLENWLRPSQSFVHKPESYSHCNTRFRLHFLFEISFNCCAQASPHKSSVLIEPYSDLLLTSLCCNYLPCNHQNYC